MFLHSKIIKIFIKDKFRNLAIQWELLAGSQIANQVPFHLKGGSVKLDLPSAVIRETYLGSGNMTSKYLLHADDVLNVGSKFLGGRYRTMDKTGKGIYRSIDNLRQLRLDSSSLNGLHNPYYNHFHLELYNKKSLRITNNHIRFYE